MRGFLSEEGLKEIESLSRAIKEKSELADDFERELLEALTYGDSKAN